MHVYYFLCILFLSILPLNADIDFSIPPWYNAPVIKPVWTVESVISEEAVELPKYSISKASRDLIVEFEITSEAYYLRHYLHPEWPEGASGITIGIGYDLGYSTKQRVAKDWHMLSDVKRLEAVTGFSGLKARNLLYTVKDVVVPLLDANEVFDNVTLIEEMALTVRTFPGADDLRPNAFGALVSLIYNRGSSLVGDRRREMRNIKALVPKKDYAGIAQELRDMKRIWRGTTPGLVRRREAEAKLVEIP